MTKLGEGKAPVPFQKGNTYKPLNSVMPFWELTVELGEEPAKKWTATWGYGSGGSNKTKSRFLLREGKKKGLPPFLLMRVWLIDASSRTFLCNERLESDVLFLVKVCCPFFLKGRNMAAFLCTAADGCIIAYSVIHASFYSLMEMNACTFQWLLSSPFEWPLSADEKYFFSLS